MVKTNYVKWKTDKYILVGLSEQVRGKWIFKDSSLGKTKESTVLSQQFQQTCFSCTQYNLAENFVIFVPKEVPWDPRRPEACPLKI